MLVAAASAACLGGNGVVRAVVARVATSPTAVVFAAKSVARYRRMEDDPDFADRYLVGTLASTALAVLAGLLARCAASR